MKAERTTKSMRKKEIRSMEKLYDVTFTQCYRARSGKVITTVVKEVVATKYAVYSYIGRMLVDYPETIRVKEANRVIYTTCYEGAVEWKMMSIKAHRLSKNSEGKEVKKIGYRVYKELTDNEGNVVYKTPSMRTGNFATARAHARVWSNGVMPMGVYEVYSDGTEKRIYAY